MFQVLALNCWCQGCFNASQHELGYKAGVVTGHWRHRQGWQCVYCGGQAYRHTHMVAALAQSVASWVGWVWWELKLGSLSKFRIVRLFHRG
jgi:hypothetical protein